MILLVYSRLSSAGSFILGGEDHDVLPLVYIGEDTFHLAVFHALNSTLCLLLDRPPLDGPKFYADFVDTVGTVLAELSADLTHAALSKVAGAAVPGGSGGDINRFLYFNASNMAVTRTVGSAPDDGRDKLVKLAADLVADLRRFGGTEGEVSAKTATEDWLVVQVAGARTIIVHLHDKNLNLMEVAKLKKSSFDNKLKSK